MDRQKIICLGDSITYGYAIKQGKVEQEKWNYPFYLQQLLKSKYEVVNVGTPGWQVKQGNQYINNIIKGEKPDLCFIMFGINDMIGSMRGGLRVSEKYFFEQFNELILKLKIKNIDVVVLTPICISNHKVDVLSEKIVRFCEEKGINYVDINKLTRLEIARSEESFKAVMPDGIHFRGDWYYIIGKLILENYFGHYYEK